MNQTDQTATVINDHDWSVFGSHRTTTLYLYAVLFIWCLWFAAKSSAKSKYVLKAPYAGYRSIFEPAWLVRLRFSKGARPQINEGYRQVTC